MLLPEGSTPSPTARPSAGVTSHAEARVSVLGALGLVAGVLAVVFLVLSGAVSETRAGRFVR
jgi:hypothetical protein